MIKRAITVSFLIFCALATADAQWMWNKDAMEKTKRELTSPAYAAAYQTLIGNADAALKKNSFSVTFKKGMAPSGDSHDYVSLSRYFWPDPSKKDGLPYINKDGESNPELENYDRNPLGNMANDVITLSLAYFFSDNPKYAQKAVKLLEVWFLDRKTRMNPNLNYAQFIPGTDGNRGRASGLIDAYSFVEMLNAVKLLETSKHYSEKDKTGLQNWFKEFIKWWETDKNAILEKNNTNNHGLAYDVQLATYSLFVGDEEKALKVIHAFPETRMFKQIEPDGSMPRELARTLGFHYSAYNIYFMVDMSATAKNLGAELYKMTSPDGRSLYKAIDFLTPYLGKDVSAWQPYRQISGWKEAQQSLCRELFRLSTLDPSCKNCYELYEKFGRPEARVGLVYRR